VILQEGTELPQTRDFFAFLTLPVSQKQLARYLLLKNEPSVRRQILPIVFSMGESHAHHTQATTKCHVLCPAFDFCAIACLLQLGTSRSGVPFHVIEALGIGLGLLGLGLVILTIRLPEPWTQKTFLQLTGASAAAIPICVVLHNLVYALFIVWFGEGFWERNGADEAFFFLLALVVCPALFLVGAVGSIVLLARTRMARH
jgi:hypothetical protein